MHRSRKPKGNQENNRHGDFKFESDDFWLERTLMSLKESGSYGMRAPRSDHISRRGRGRGGDSEIPYSNRYRPHRGFFAEVPDSLPENFHFFQFKPR